ncbi:MAG: exodeoxyribonuclease V subunit gamma [Thermodesulfobacteriota bacterium]
MAGFHLFTGNRLENLTERLAGRMREQPPPPLQPEVIVVQSEGMQKWLSLQLADAHGVCANIAYLFPKSLAQDLYQRVLAAGDPSIFSPETLTWSVMKTLPGLLDDREFADLKHYLREDTTGLNRFYLARQIAEMLGRYCLLRPDVILAWSRGKNPLAVQPASRWQSILWRKILDDLPPQARGMDPASLHYRLLSAPAPLAGLPERISVFGISTLAPYYVDFFLKLAEQIDVDVYYMNPCRQYWEYVFSEKEMARFAAEGVPEEAACVDEGNRLLSSLGTAGREFFSFLLNRLGDAGEDLFSDPGGGDMLTAVQSDVLNLVDGDGQNRRTVAADDASIQVHVCHSPIREVEVLHDRLMAILESDAGVQPRDIVVMMPDVAAYAPLIQAVFDAPEHPAAMIPYSIADATVRQANTVTGALLAILTMDRNRYRAPDVLDLLGHSAVRNRFGLSGHDLNRVRGWVEAAGIRWGIDGAYRAGLGLPDFYENTWAFGLDRMLLGHALPPSSPEKMFAGILPWGEFEEESSRTLGKAVSFVRTLVNRCRSLKTSKTLPEWTDTLNGILTDFFLADDEATENDIMEIRRMILDGGLTAVSELTGFRDPVSLDVIRDYLESRLAGASRSSGFISNGVTFCTLLPMRSIPFKVVCLLGMSDGDFPRTSHRPGFDLLEKQRRLCDFSKTFEDRYLFLESLLSARKFLIVSYVGQDIRDNSLMPPSSLVRELLEYLERGFTTGDGTRLLEQVVTRHPLQPFSPKYFQDSVGLFSYSEENYAAALRNREGKSPPRRLFDRLLPEPPGETWQPLGLDQLVSFFRNPAAFLLKTRLNLDFAVADKERAEDREPFSLDFLQQYLIRQDLVDAFVRYGRDRETALAVIKASGRLPHGSFGEIAWETHETEARRFAEVVFPYLEGGPIEPESIECRLNDSRQTILQGVADGLYPRGQLFYRCAGIKAADILRAWVYHLAVNAVVKNGPARSTHLIGTDDPKTFTEMAGEEAAAYLVELVGLFYQGLTAPLPFFPATSLALAETIIEGKSVEAARTAAVGRWRSNDRRPGEGEDVHVSRCFDETVLDDERFRRIALAVYGPVFRHLRA